MGDNSSRRLIVSCYCPFTPSLLYAEAKENALKNLLRRFMHFRRLLS